jgi:hypothetical protein
VWLLEKYDLNLEMIITLKCDFMKKKLFLSLGLIVLAVIFYCNIKLCTVVRFKNIALCSIGLWNHASAESKNSNECNGEKWCSDGNDLKYDTFTSQNGEVVCCGQASVTRGRVRS